MNKLRLDKWLWAARFFKTRSLAKQAIDGGKVRANGERAKASKEIEIGTILRIRQGWDEKEVTVLALSDQRRGAVDAQKLYEESQESIQQRETKSQQRKTMEALVGRTPGKPTSKQRRDLQRIKRVILPEDDDSD